MEHTGTQDTDTRVLLVDDDPIILELLSTGLTKAGYRVDACTEAKRALAHYHDTTPDVAVLDVGLPDMSGTDLARELLHSEYRPILILSNYKDLDTVQQAITSGVVGYLVKPLSVEQLIPSLETSLSRYRKRREWIASHLDSDSVSAQHLTEVMDRFPFGLLIVDRHHHPIYRNAPARALLQDKVLNIDPAGRLRARMNSERFVPLLDQALGKTAPRQWGAVLLEAHPTRRLHAWAAPLMDKPDYDGETLAAVTVFDSERDHSYTWDAMKTLYKLTRKETNLINGLLKGQTIEDYCSANFVTANTVRTHLKSIYRKTDTNRQAEVVRLFSSMFMPFE
ncbi:MAG: putative transcriptional regulatory protein pdtaR [Gammaproteobacteria bacterium]|nr:putative transcriptional regulatory protein pdtaR [Gammaproteobacteria bacterium]